MQSLCSSRDTSNWRLVQNPQHMWSHSIDFIFSNYYPCLVVYVSVVSSAYVDCSLWSIHTNTDTDTSTLIFIFFDKTSTLILIWANDTIQCNHICQCRVTMSCQCQQWHVTDTKHAFDQKCMCTIEVAHSSKHNY